VNRILITGSAGFIGFNLSKYLLEKKYEVYGIDNLNNYYSVKLKKERLKILKKYKNFYFKKIDLCNTKQLNLIKKINFNYVFHLAAQAGVGYSMKNPQKYIHSNINGFCNLVEFLKNKKINKFFYASSSSVYGDHKKFPLKEELNIKPKNVYGLTKKFNEEIAEIYSSLYKIKFIGLRFFTVFGEWGRPDMFMLKFLNASFNKFFFYLNNNGNHFRDFTYIGDVVKSLFKLINIKQKKNHEVINICSNNPVSIKKIIKHFIAQVQSPRIIMRGFQLGDMIKTHGDNSKLKRLTKDNKFTTLNTSLNKTIDWYIKNKIYKF
jgi:UDP-glucuronate 4-epimerase